MAACICSVFNSSRIFIERAGLMTSFNQLLQIEGYGASDSSYGSSSVGCWPLRVVYR